MRKPRSIPTIVAGLAAVLAPASALATPPLLGLNTTDTGSTLYDIDPATGAASNPRALTYGGLVGMAFSADGVLYAGSDDWAAVPNTLFTINPATGSMTIVGETGVPNREGDLAFDPTTGNLFQLKSAVYTAGGVDSSDLMLLDKSNGDPTFVGTVRRGNDLSAMAFDGVGRLFVVDTDDEELLLVDTLTASILDTTALSGPLGDVAGMDSDPTSSALYVADGGSDGSLGSLYTVDPATGQVSTIGPTGLTYGLSGLVFVPEPGACSILLLGTLILGRQRARANRT